MSMSHGTAPIGAIAGIKLRAHWSVLITLALLTWIAGVSLNAASGASSALVVWSAAFTVALGLLMSLCAHELAHAITARRNGVHVERITLWLLGGMSELNAEPDDPDTELRIAMAGPTISAILGGALLILLGMLGPGTPDTIAAALSWLAVMNIMLTAFNLLPGAPLDGGRVLRALIWRRTGDRLRGTAIASRAGSVLGVILMGLGVLTLLTSASFGGVWFMLLGWFLWTAANAELASATLRHRLGDTRVGEVMTAVPLAVPSEWTVAHFLRSDAPRTAHRVFPVVDPDGHPAAVLPIQRVIKLPAHLRATTAVGTLAVPLPDAALTKPDEPLTAVMTRVLLRPGLDLLAVVNDSGRLCGMVTASDLTTACDRTALGLPARRVDPDADWEFTHRVQASAQPAVEEKQ